MTDDPEAKLQPPGTLYERLYNWNSHIVRTWHRELGGTKIKPLVPPDDWPSLWIDALAAHVQLQSFDLEDESVRRYKREWFQLLSDLKFERRLFAEGKRLKVPQKPGCPTEQAQLRLQDALANAEELSLNKTGGICELPLDALPRIAAAAELIHRRRHDIAMQYPLNWPVMPPELPGLTGLGRQIEAGFMVASPSLRAQVQANDAAQRGLQQQKQYPAPGEIAEQAKQKPIQEPVRLPSIKVHPTLKDLLLAEVEPLPELLGDDSRYLKRLKQLDEELETDEIRKVLTTLLHRHQVGRCGDLIEALADWGCSVELEVHTLDGESMILKDVTGEFKVQVQLQTPIPNFDKAPRKPE